MAERLYGDFCGLARALDVIGDRWALLIVRELLLGPKRFVDLRAGLGRISPNVFSQRLGDLETAGVLRRIRLEPPANVAAYELTPRGRQLRPALLELTRWGLLVPQAAGAHHSSAALLLNLDARFEPSAVSEPVVANLTIGSERFAMIVTRGGLEVRRGHRDGADLTMEATAAALSAALLGDGDAARLEAGGELLIRGGRTNLARLKRCFPRPPAPVD